MPLLEPVPPVDLERPLGVPGAEQDEAIAPPKLDGEPVQEAQHLGRRLQGEARDPDDAEMMLADTWLESAVEVLAREHAIQVHGDPLDPNQVPQPRDARVRSEEHTSELQSHSDLVCRLLLEKKKNG